MSLFCWRLLLPLVVQLRHPLLVTTAVALGLGYVEEFGSSSRPAGRWCTCRCSTSAGGWARACSGSGSRAGGACRSPWPQSSARSPRRRCGTGTSRVLALHAPRLPGRHPARHGGRLADPTGRTGLGGGTGALHAAADAQAAGATGLRARAGGFTVYLLHPLVILPLREKGLIARADTPLELVALVAFGVLLTMVLASPFVRRLVRPLTRPPVGRLLAPAPAAAPPAASRRPRRRPVRPAAIHPKQALRERSGSHADGRDRRLTSG
ncbi:hypothetical protein ACR6C2_19465 [Streptomyces sp. INA 01156]